MLKQIILLMGLLLLVSPAFAQSKYSIKTMTPEVKAALDSRKERYDQLREFKAKGLIGENNHGYVELLSQDTTAVVLVDQENKDRRVVYKTIAQQNGLEDALATIEKVFGAVQREKAGEGEMVQQDSGKWVAK